MGNQGDCKTISLTNVQLQFEISLDFQCKKYVFGLAKNSVVAWLIFLHLKCPFTSLEYYLQNISEWSAKIGNSLSSYAPTGWSLARALGYSGASTFRAGSLADALFNLSTEVDNLGGYVVSLSKLASGDGFKTNLGKFNFYSSGGNNIQLDFAGFMYEYSHSWSPFVGSAILDYKGEHSNISGGDIYPRNWLRQGFMGLGVILRGSSGSSVTGSLVSSTDLSETDFSANNLLSMLGVLLPLQNDLARVANVIADPADIAINDANKDNKESFLDTFGSGDAAVSGSNISSVGDLSGVVSSSFNTSVSAGDFISQFSNNDRFALFSEQTASDVDTVPATFGLDDDFIDFYDPDNNALWELIGQGSGN